MKLGKFSILKSTQWPGPFPKKAIDVPADKFLDIWRCCTQIKEGCKDRDYQGEHEVSLLARGFILRPI